MIWTKKCRKLSRAHRRYGFKKKVRRYTFERTRAQVLTQNEIYDESESRENQHNGSEGAPVDRAAVANFLNESYTPHIHATVKRSVFFLTSKMKEELKRALKSAPKHKAPGPDGIFAEMLQINAEISLSLLLAIAS